MALIGAGYDDEARDWRDWLLRAVAGSPAQMQIMYGIAGERRLTEWEVPWLPGYEGARPVRIGNGAHGQLQLDVYGEVMDALHQARRAGLAEDEAGWALQRALLDHLETVWREPDEGIWEVRGPRRHFTFSKVMAWVAFDRAVQERRSLRPRRAGRSLARAGHRDPRGGLPARLRRRAQLLRAVLRVAPARCELAAIACLGLSAGNGCTDHRDGGGDRASSARGRSGGPLRHPRGHRRAASRRGRLPRLQLLALRRLHHALDQRRWRRCRRSAPAPAARWAR